MKERKINQCWLNIYNIHDISIYISMLNEINIDTMREFLLQMELKLNIIELKIYQSNYLSIYLSIYLTF
jgi:hypothetical protein